MTIAGFVGQSAGYQDPKALLWRLPVTLMGCNRKSVPGISIKKRCTIYNTPVRLQDNPLLFAVPHERNWLSHAHMIHDLIDRRSYCVAISVHL
jgi:hypothetical protein